MQATKIVDGGRLAVILALVCGLASATWAQAPAAESGPAAAAKNVSKAAAPAAARRTATKPASGQQEGITVHGHWVIEVRNPDGTLVSRTEFENALEPQGMFILSNVMAGGGASFVVSNWRLIVRSTSGSLCPSQPQPQNFGQGACIIAPASDTGVAAQSRDLISFALGTDPNQGASLVVKGSFKAEADVTIDSVRSGINAGSFYFFSSKTLAPADQRHVIAGQIVQVALTISFS